MSKNIKKISARTITLTIIFILILIVIALLIGKFSYSYLAPTIDDDVEGVGEVTASGDTIIFTKGNTLSLSANADNFATGGSNLTATTNPKVKLMASSKTNSASSKYFAGIIIKNNTYFYTTDDKKPEVILTVKDENGNLVTTSSDNLTFVTVNDNLQGFDITGVNGAFNIVTDHVIVTPSNKSEVIHTWTFTLTFVNLETDQSENENSTLEMDVVLQKNKLLTSIADFCANGDNLNDCIVSTYNGLGEISSIYYHNATLANGTEDNSYRYAGANPNNYVCFGSDDETCPYENLFRIIGLIDGRIKLISSDGATIDMLGKEDEYNNSYGGSGRSKEYYKGSGDLLKMGIYRWDPKGTNALSTSSLYTTNLNTNFLTYLDGKNAKWKTMIDDTTWYVGGMNTTNGTGINAKTAYDYEIGVNKDTISTLTAKIGLMYLTDFYYAAPSKYWIVKGNHYQRINDYSMSFKENWMSIGLDDWTISKNTSYSYVVFYVAEDGASSYISSIFPCIVRPVFNLISSIKYVSGSGTSENPIRISL